MNFDMKDNRNGRLTWTMLSIALMLSGIANAAPLRLLVQPPSNPVYAGIEKSRESIVAQCLGLYLYDWLGRENGLLIVDEEQARHLFAGLSSPAMMPLDVADIRSAVEKYVRLDAVVHWTWKAGVLTIRLERADADTVSREIPWRDAADAAGALKTVTDWLSQELRVGTATTSLARGLPILDPRFIEDYLIAERYHSIWSANDGVEQLNMLRRNREIPARDPWVAAAVVRAVARASEDPSGQVPSPEGLAVTAMQYLPTLLGTEREPVALDFCRVNKFGMGTVEKGLLALIRNAGKDGADASIDDAIDAIEGRDESVDLTVGGPAVSLDGAGAAATEPDPAREAGAVRCLGLLRSKPALEHFSQIAGAADPGLRRAVAWALAHYAAPAGAAELDRLRRDPDSQTAFLAAWALSRRGAAPDDLTRRAAACLRDNPECEEAAAVLTLGRDAAETAPLAAFLADHRGKRRAMAVAALARTGSLNASAFEAALHDPDSAVLRAAVWDLPAPMARTQQVFLITLANHPDAAIADAARGRLAAMVPTDPRQRRLFELAMEHPYVRRKLVEELARDPADEAVADLTEATANPDPHTRALALRLLAEQQPNQARPHVLRLVADPHRWVRLHAAAVAARVAAAPDIGALRATLRGEQDEATRLYLEDALARAEGRSATAPRPGANLVSNERGMLFVFEHQEDCVNSPIEGYYDLAYKPHGVVAEHTLKAHAAGKVFLARANRTARNPAQVCLNLETRDSFWIGLQDEFSDLSALDGVVLGEESMYFAKGQMWEAGWRLFCREAGIDPRRVGGDIKNLSPAEDRAWWSWEQRVAIEGFNIMYDWIKLSFGRLRPGFQVCTFMPNQNGPCEFDREWKFDIGAGYFYETSNRHRYTQVRRLRTTWPDRPVLWLYDGHPQGAHATGLHYLFKAVTSPVMEPSMPNYADALCIWMAGGHPGSYYARLAVDKQNMDRGMSASGIHIRAENILPPLLTKTVDMMFRGIDETYRTEVEMESLRRQGPQSPDITEAADPDLIRDLLDAVDPQEDPIATRVAAGKERVSFGLQIEQKMVYDTARLVSGLPLTMPANDVLLLGDESASAGALRLPQRYDYLEHVNKLAGMALKSYRFIGVANHDQTLLRDDAIRDLSDWLKETPGLLYVRGWLPTEPDSGQPALGNLSGRLDTAWPWRGDVAMADKAYRITGAGARPIKAGVAGTLVIWQGNGFKGAVLFDQSDLAPAELRSVVNKAGNDLGVGIAFADPIGMERAEFPGVAAAASCQRGPVEGEFVLPGVDLLTGIVNPSLTKTRGAAFVAEEYRGKYAAAHGGVAILCERPITSVTPLAEGLEIDGGVGLIQAVSVKGAVEIRGPQALPDVDSDNVLPWLFRSQEPGVARMARKPGEATVAYVRANGKLTFLSKSQRSTLGEKGNKER